MSTKKTNSVKTLEKQTAKTSGSKNRLINRDLSLLQFNYRVLHQALDSRNPLLERLRFIMIFRSNLDEFFMKRVGTLKNQVLKGIGFPHAEPSGPKSQLMMIREMLGSLFTKEAECLTKELLPSLKDQDIELVKMEDLSTEECQRATTYFKETLFPVLTPLSVDHGHPFPFISSLSTSFGILLRDPEKDEEFFARVKLPNMFSSWFRVDSGNGGSGADVTIADGHSSDASTQKIRLLCLADLVAAHFSALFPGLEVAATTLFRVTRNTSVEKGMESDLDLEEDDLLELVAEEIRERRFGDVVRVEHGPDADPRILKILAKELEITPDEFFESALPLPFYSLGPIADLNRAELKYHSYLQKNGSAFDVRGQSVFEAIRKKDILVHHPYESFQTSVERFIHEACDDPKVLGIKMTLYRTGEDSPFIPLLIRAAAAGKQVACLVELKARMDEERNIRVAQMLEEAGVHVVYGIAGLKTHCKLALVVRQEEKGVRTYTHVGTGNYHSKTSRLYTDFGLFTSNPKVTADVVQLFHHLTGRSNSWKFNHLLVAPFEMKHTFQKYIEREIQHAKARRPAYILAKMNGLEHEEIIEDLYRASNAGVKIDLLVRGMCSLRPKVNGMSENIRVFSILGRFLEHSRAYFFQNGQIDRADGDLYVGSADWMKRNLDHRVEAATPILDRDLKKELLTMLQIMISDPVQAWELESNGEYLLRGGLDEDLSASSQSTFMNHYSHVFRTSMKNEKVYSAAIRGFNDA